MYTQFFGNYLLSRGVVTTDQLADALREQSNAHIKLGTLAIHYGYMTASEVENIVIQQTHQDKRFGELAVTEGYLTESQVKELVEAQNPDYLLLGQILVEQGILSRSEFETLLIDYQSENELADDSIGNEQRENVDQLVKNFLALGGVDENDRIIEYLSLLFNNLVRFIGNDFTPLNLIPCDEIPVNYCILQNITGNLTLISALDLEEDTAIQFASRYVGDTFTEFDEYVKASVEDFLNLHNGLFNVNMSSDYAMELFLDPPELVSGDVLHTKLTTYLLPIVYSFGILDFIIAI